MGNEFQAPNFPEMDSVGKSLKITFATQPIFPNISCFDCKLCARKEKALFRNYMTNIVNSELSIDEFRMELSTYHFLT